MPRTRASLLVVAGALLLVVGVHLLQATQRVLGVPLRVGPATVTVGPSEAYRYVFQWRVVEQNPRVVSGRGYLLHESLAGPVSCRSLDLLLARVEAGCGWAVFAVKLVNVTPGEALVNLTLVVRGPGGNYSVRRLGLREWAVVRVVSTEPYATYILNAGSVPARITVYYGVGRLEEARPYTVHGLLLAAAGLVLVAGAVASTVRRGLRP